MYPDFYHLLKDLTGISIPVLSLFKTFGFLVAIGFFTAGYLLYKEIKRKEEEGLIGFTIEEITTGKPLQWSDYLISTLIAFFLGFKISGLIVDWKEASPDPMSYLISSKGLLLPGILAAMITLVFRYFENRKTVKQGIQVKKVKTYPHVKVGDICVIAAIGGFAGAKIFNALETWSDFVRDPLGSLFSSSGLTFYGGLIVATLALWRYSKKIHLDFRHLCDAAAPVLILAYGIGRIGCQLSGDGDWGIYNSAYTTSPAGQIVPASKPAMEEAMVLHPDYFTRHADEGQQHLAVKGTSILPVWFFAFNYPHNVNHVGVPIPDCTDEYCSVLPQPVFPTPVYETLFCILAFFLLWGIRKRIQVPIGLFAIYLIINGAERFLIEQIRVNYKYNWGFIHPTQAEIIAVMLILCGSMLWIFRKQIHQKWPTTSSV